MKTAIIKIDISNPERDRIKKAALALGSGELVVIPTETVYGIAVNMLDKRALKRLYAVKQRPADKPFSIHIADREDVYRYVREILPAAYRLMKNFWPGPLTLVFNAKDEGKVGIRMPNHTVAQAIIRGAGVPVVCPSANISGHVAPSNLEEVLKDLDGLVDLIVDSGQTPLNQESSVVDVSALPIKVLRAGAISGEDIEKVANRKTVLFVCTGNSCRSVMAEALLKKKMKDKKRLDVQVLSAGIIMTGGLGATEETRELLEKEGIDVSGHASQPINKDLVSASELILVMEKLHEQRVIELFPEAKNRVFLLEEFARIGASDLDIADPIGRPLEFYEYIFSVIKEAIERISNVI